MDFDWKRKSRLQEQLKFFGAKKTRFISCYAKKPKIKVKLKPNIKIETDFEAQTLYGLANLDSQSSALGGAFMCHSGLGALGALGAQQARVQQAIHQARLMQQRQSLNTYNMSTPRRNTNRGHTIESGSTSVMMPILSASVAASLL